MLRKMVSLGLNALGSMSVLLCNTLKYSMMRLNHVHEYGLLRSSTGSRHQVPLSYRINDTRLHVLHAPAVCSALTLPAHQPQEQAHTSHWACQTVSCRAGQGQT